MKLVHQYIRKGEVICLTIIPLEPIWILRPFVLMLLFLISTELIRAFMEWKHAENKNGY